MSVFVLRKLGVNLSPEEGMIKRYDVSLYACRNYRQSGRRSLQRRSVGYDRDMYLPSPSTPNEHAPSVQASRRQTKLWHGGYEDTADAMNMIQFKAANCNIASGKRKARLRRQIYDRVHTYLLLFQFLASLQQGPLNRTLLNRVAVLQTVSVDLSQESWDRI